MTFLDPLCQSLVAAWIRATASFTPPVYRALLPLPAAQHLAASHAATRTDLSSAEQARINATPLKTFMHERVSNRACKAFVALKPSVQHHASSYVHRCYNVALWSYHCHILKVPQMLTLEDASSDEATAAAAPALFWCAVWPRRKGNASASGPPTRSKPRAERQRKAKSALWGFTRVQVRVE
ncbi:hypothetical protein EDB84DRAFT_1443887 [Lactarius hengduanensis]|nr:hypothetical protein EDB84DRAFT_1443887 [Lactarius hengduanensis]